jgi:hypothetical protein
MRARGHCRTSTIQAADWIVRRLALLLCLIVAVARRHSPDDARVQVYPRDDVHVVVVGGEANAMMQGWQMWGAVTVSVDKWR